MVAGAVKPFAPAPDELDAPDTHPNKLDPEEEEAPLNRLDPEAAAPLNKPGPEPAPRNGLVEAPAELNKPEEEVPLNKLLEMDPNGPPDEAPEIPPPNNPPEELLELAPPNKPPTEVPKRPGPVEAPDELSAPNKVPVAPPNKPDPAVVPETSGAGWLSDTPDKGLGFSSLDGFGFSPPPEPPAVFAASIVQASFASLLSVSTLPSPAEIPENSEIELFNFLALSNASLNVCASSTLPNFSAKRSTTMSSSAQSCASQTQHFWLPAFGCKSQYGVMPTT
mmetsp:Transcript_64991/g.163764  ORF Transcript_64991/g.163764 Transcript_64991/m.163764 type:complete len:279 (-) Transcript_64991:2187-3023(-)